MEGNQSNNLINLGQNENKLNALIRNAGEGRLFPTEIKEALGMRLVKRKRVRGAEQTQDPFTKPRKMIAKTQKMLRVVEDKRLLRETAKQKKEAFRKIAESLGKARREKRKGEDEFEEYVKKLTTELAIDRDAYQKLLLLPKNDLFTTTIKRIGGIFPKKMKFQMHFTSQNDSVIALSNNYTTAYGFFFNCLAKDKMVFESPLNQSLLADIRVLKQTTIYHTESQSDYLNSIYYKFKWAGEKDQEAALAAAFKSKLLQNKENVDIEVKLSPASQTLPVDAALVEYRRLGIENRNGVKEVFSIMLNIKKPEKFQERVQTALDNATIYTYRAFSDLTTTEDKGLNDLEDEEFTVGYKLGFDAENGKWVYEMPQNSRILPGTVVSCVPDVYGNEVIMLGCVNPERNLFFTHIFDLETTSMDFVRRMVNNGKNKFFSAIFEGRKSEKIAAHWGRLFEDPSIGFANLDWPEVQRPLLILFNRLSLFSKLTRDIENLERSIVREFRKYVKYIPLKIDRMDIIEMFQMTKDKLTNELRKIEITEEFISKSKELQGVIEKVKLAFGAVMSSFDLEGKELLSELQEYFTNWATTTTFKIKTLQKLKDLEQFQEFCVWVSSESLLLPKEELAILNFFKERQFQIDITEQVKLYYKSFSLRYVETLDFKSIIGIDSYITFRLDVESSLKTVTDKLVSLGNLSVSANNLNTGLFKLRPEGEGLDKAIKEFQIARENWANLLKKTTEAEDAALGAITVIKNKMLQKENTAVFELVKKHNFKTFILNTKNEYLRAVEGDPDPRILATFGAGKELGDRQIQKARENLENPNLDLDEDLGSRDALMRDGDEDMASQDTGIDAIKQSIDSIKNNKAVVEAAFDELDNGDDEDWGQFSLGVRDAVLSAKSEQVFVYVRNALVDDTTNQKKWVRIHDELARIAVSVEDIDKLKAIATPADEVSRGVLRDILVLDNRYNPIQGLANEVWYTYVTRVLLPIAEERFNSVTNPTHVPEPSVVSLISKLENIEKNKEVTNATSNVGRVDRKIAEIRKNNRGKLDEVLDINERAKEKRKNKRQKDRESDEKRDKKGGKSLIVRPGKN